MLLSFCRMCAVPVPSPSRPSQFFNDLVSFRFCSIANPTANIASPVLLCDFLGDSLCDGHSLFRLSTKKICKLEDLHPENLAATKY
jgi:hypothetical protein